MHYYLGKSLAEIGKKFGVTESRVCQIHTKALKSIREGLKEPSSKNLS
jgi:RNA polymerase sigma factor for flagellar operon FliA